MQPSHPDDAGSPSPGEPPRPHQKPLPPGVVYALDCLERGTPAQVRRHLIALGYAPAEAAELVRTALAQRDPEHSSAWSPEDASARRCMALGFLLLVCGIVAGCVRTYLLPQLPPSVPPVLEVFAWGGIVVGLIVFLLGIAQMRISRK
jgi:hypothetical protein